MQIKFVAAGDLEDGRIQVFAIDGGGNIFSRWKASIDPNSGWTNWSAFQTPAHGATSMAYAYLSDKRPQLFASDGLGNMFSCWKTTIDPNASWTPWTPF
jgi:hypothetical protein